MGRTESGSGRRVDSHRIMNVSCSNCPAKYAIPDEKVRGKKVRIKCKHCGAAIVVDGTHLGGPAAKAAASAARPAAASPRPAPEPKPPAAASTGATVGTAAPTAAKAPAAAAPRPAVSPAPTGLRSGRSSAKQTMLGVPLPAVGAAPAPPAAGKAPAADTSPKAPAADTSPKPITPAAAPRPAAKPSPAPEPAAPAPRTARSAAKRTIIGGLEAAPGSTPFVQQPGATPGVPRPEAGSVPGPISEPAPVSRPEPEWTVAITDEHHEEMDTPEVVALYAAGTIDEETFIWKDGMDDWATPFEIPKIARALAARGLYPGGDASEAATTVGAPGAGVWHEPGSWNEPPVAPGADIDEVGFDDVTVSMAAPKAIELIRAAEARDARRHSVPTEPPPAPMAGQRAYVDQADDEPGPDDVTVMRQGLPDYDAGDHSDDVTVMGPSPSFSAEGALLERPAAPRPAAGAPAKAQPEPAPEPPAPRPPQPSASLIDGKPAGARNESSVLFSLDALMNQEAPAPREPEPRSEDVFGMQAEPTANAVRAPALSAPDFSDALMHAPPPPPSVPETQAPPMPAQEVEQPSKSKGGSGAAIWVLLVVLLLAGGGFASYHFRYPPQMWSALLARFAPGAAPTASAAAPAASLSAAPAPSAAAPASASAEASAEAPSTSAAAPSAGSTARAPTSEHNTGAPTGTKPELGAKPEASASTAPVASAAPAASAAPPFDKSAAASALAAAAGSAASCKQADTPAGTGRVVVTFMPSGRATNAIVSGDFAGSAVGGCVARLFRGTKVPPFSGSPVTVARSFVIH